MPLEIDEQHHRDDEMLVQRLVDAPSTKAPREDTITLVQQLIAVWLRRGGKVTIRGRHPGRKRHSIRYVNDFLNDIGNEIKSLQPKLDGRTGLNRDDLKNLLDLILRHWKYIGPLDETNAKSDNYDPIEDIDIDGSIELISTHLFPQKSNNKSIRLSRNTNNETRFKPASETIPEQYRRCAALVTFSSHQTIVAPDPPSAIRGFRDVLHTLWRSKNKADADPLLIWVVDRGSRSMEDPYALWRFWNTRTLATQFHALSQFSDYEGPERWRWLTGQTVIVVGSVGHDGVSELYVDDVPPPRQLLPSLHAEHVMIGEIPRIWAGDPNFQQLYGRKLEGLDSGVYTAFLSQGEENTDKSQVGYMRIRYDGYVDPKKLKGPKPTSTDSDSAIGAELPSPGPWYDNAFQIVYGAACFRLKKDWRNRPQIISSAEEAFAHLRHLGFAILTLEEFLNMM